MPLTPVARRRAVAVLAVVAVVAVVCFATGHGVVATVLVALTPLLVYRVTGHSWRQAAARASGREPVRVPAAPADRRARRPLPARPSNPAAAILLIVVGVPAGLGLLSALAGQVAGGDEVAVPVGMVMTVTWTAFAALTSGMVVREGRRGLVALAAGAATVASVLLWVGVVFGG
jgi:hypothetical protein